MPHYPSLPAKTAPPTEHHMTAYTASPSISAPLPEKIALLIHEARWLLVAAAGIYLGLILWGFDRNDPGWSHALTVERVANPGGRFGAWLADLLLYLLGMSAWLWVALPFFLIFWGYHRVNHLFEGNRRSLMIGLLGFGLLTLAACGLEAMRFWSLKATLPLGPGGLLGSEIGLQAGNLLGYTGGTLLLLVVAMVGFSLFTGTSWLAVAERIGAALEHVWLKIIAIWEIWRDRQYGRSVAERREAAVEQERRKTEEHPTTPVKIEPAHLEEQLEQFDDALEPTLQQATNVDFAEVDPEDDDLLDDAPPPRIAMEHSPAALAMSEPAAAQSNFVLVRQTKPKTEVTLAEGSLPSLDLLALASLNTADIPSAETLEFTSRLIERKLADFNVQVRVLTASPGPVVTRYEIDPAVGVKGSQVVNLAKDLSRALSLVSIRVVETVVGKSCMALELPNPKRQIVRLSELIGSLAYRGMSSPLTMVLGKDIGGQPVVADLSKMPHLLVAGTTGSGKSVGVNAMILSMLYKSPPKDVRMIMIDPKMLELSIYEGIPHLLAPVVTDMNKAANALHWCVGEMERRYKLLSAVGVRNLASFNGKINDAAKDGELIPNPLSLTLNSECGPEPLTTLPHIVVVIDELADLMMVVGKKVEELIARLAQKARAAGIHLILATQRPSVDVITGLIKANIPTRIAFQVSSKIDSRTILDQMGAEALLGQGDMLYLAPGTGLPTRVHGAFVADDEVHHVVDFLKKTGKPNYIESILSAPSGDEESIEVGAGGTAGAEADPMYDQAVEVVLKTRRPSISLVQRHLRIGYNRAARMIEAMEKAGLVSPANGAGNREVLAPEKSE